MSRPTSAPVKASMPVASVDEVVDPAHWKVTGDLTIHGVARPVLLDTGGAYLGERVQISLSILALLQ